MIYPVTNLHLCLDDFQRPVAEDLLQRAQDCLRANTGSRYICLMLERDLQAFNAHGTAQAIKRAIRTAIGPSRYFEEDARDVEVWLREEHDVQEVDEFAYRIEWIDHMLKELEQ